MKTTQLALSALMFIPSLCAQDGTPAPPPTYDYDTATPGVQGPKSPLLAGYTYRSVRPYQVGIPVLVPIADMQAILPPGFTAVATPAGATNTTLTLSFFLDQRFQPDATSLTTFGPASAMLVSATVLNTNLATPRQELVFPCFEASAYVDQLNATFGPGAARKAKVRAEFIEHNGNLKFKFVISDSDLGFDITVSGEGPAALNNRSISDPVGLPFRTFNGMQANQSFWASSQTDSLAVPITATNLTLATSDNRLHFPGGSLGIVGFGANMTLSRNVEFILKFE